MKKRMNGKKTRVARAGVWIVENEGRECETVESQMIRAAAQKQGLAVEVLSPDDATLVSNASNAIYVKGKRVAVPPVTLSRTGAESSLKALALYRHLEASGSRVVNPAAPVAVSKSKFATAQRLSTVVPIPTTMRLEENFDPEFVRQQIGLPLVAKFSAGTRGEGLMKVDCLRELQDLVSMIGDLRRRPVLLQQYIAESAGQDLRVLVVGGKVIGCMRRQAQQHGQWKSNVALGGKLSLARVTPEVERISLEATRRLGLTIAGVDLLLGEQGPILNEVNSAPDFAGVLEASEGRVDVATSIVDYVRRTLRDLSTSKAG